MVSYRSSPQDQAYGRPVPPGYPGTRPKRTRWLVFLIPLVAIVFGFGSVVWLAYLEGAPVSALGDPPLIKADGEPIKLEPDDPGGLQVAERGAVGELLGENPDGSTERLLPPPEEPIETPSAEQLAAAASEVDEELSDAQRAAGGASADDQTRRQAQAQAGDDAAAGSDRPAGDELRSTITGREQPPADLEAAIRELFEDVPAEVAQPEVLRPGPVSPTLGAQDPRQVTRPVTPGSRGTSEPDGQQEVAALDRSPAEAAPDADRRPDDATGERTVTPAVAPAARPSPGDQALLEGPHFRVQLAAVRNEADAQRAWDLFLLDYGEVLAGIEPLFERGETTNGVFYRVQLGPYQELARAEAMCEELKQRDASCFVLRR